jgi:hypothetical protein
MTSKINQIQLEELAAQIQQALLLADQGDLIGSEELYHQVLKQMPGHPLALYGLAQLAGAINDLEVKEVLLGQAIEQLIGEASPDNKSLAATWLTELAELLFKLNRATDASNCLKQCEHLISENLKVPLSY